MSEAEARKALLKLVRHILGHAACKKDRGGPSEIVLTRPDGVARRFAEPTVRAALTLGLAVEREGRVGPSETASAFLRRALASPDATFADQHRLIGERTVPVEGGHERVRVNLIESPLATMARLKEKSGGAFLPEDALSAGQRLHADFTRANLQPRLTMSYAPRLDTRTKGAAPGADLSDSALAARGRVARAMEAIGPELCGVALDVCCFEKGLETVERERQWPARSAKLMLRAALMALSRHYAPPPQSPRRRHAWGDDGYRPDMAGRSG